MLSFDLNFYDFFKEIYWLIDFNIISNLSLKKKDKNKISK
jgi:hypothetical protein